MKINTEKFEIDIIDESMYSLNSADNVRQYDIEYILGENYGTTPRFGIYVKNKEAKENKCFILGNRIGSSTPHEKSAIVVDDHLYIAIGNLVCCLDLPSLVLLWHKEVDFANSFGIYLSPDNLGIISHGELDIVKVSFAGEILWSAGGRDIFTGDFTIYMDHIEVFDFNDDKYEIDIISGESVLVQSRKKID